MTLKMEVAEDLDRERDDPLGARLFIQVPLDFCVLVTGCSTNQWSSGLRTFIIVFTASDISDVIFVTKLYKRVKSIFDSIGLFTHMNKKDIALFSSCCPTINGPQWFEQPNRVVFCRKYGYHLSGLKRRRTVRQARGRQTGKS